MVIIPVHPVAMFVATSAHPLQVTKDSWRGIEGIQFRDSICEAKGVDLGLAMLDPRLSLY